MPAVAGHGALIAIELDPVSSPGVFTTVAELNGDIVWPALTRPKSDVTAHQHQIGHNVRGVMMTEDLTWSVNYIFDDPTHSFSSGLYKHMVDNRSFGVRLRGPGGSSGVDEWIMSGGLTSITQTAPVREGARTSDIVFSPSGPFIIDAATVGADLV